MFAAVGLIGFVCLCVGVYRIVKVLIRRDIEGRTNAVKWLLVGWVLFFGALFADMFKYPSSTALGLLGWTGMWAGVYGLVRGQIGPIGRLGAMTGRGKAAIVLAAGVILLATAPVVTDSADKATASRIEKEKAAAIEAKYQAAVDVYSSRQWDKTIEALQSVQGYKDADSLLVEARYSLTKAAVDEKRWIDARDALALVPDTYKDAADLKTAVKDGLTLMYYNDAMKFKSQGNYSETARLFALANETGGKAPPDLEAQLKAATALHEKALAAEAEKAAKERERAAKIEKDAGPKPENSPWDAAVRPVVDFLKVNLKDPRSIEYIEWSPVKLVDVKGTYYWAVRVKYRAKNSFGGYVIEQKLFLIQHGQIVDVANM